VAVFHLSLGVALANQGKPAEAEAQIRIALEIQQKLTDKEPNFPHSRLMLAKGHRALGRLLAQQGKLTAAETEYRAALKNYQRLAEAHLDSPGYRRLLADGHNALGNALRGKGQLDEAMEEYREAIRIQNDYAQAHCNLGQVLLHKGRLTEALRYYRRGHELGSRNPRWSHPSAQWVRDCERLVELDGKLPAILSGQKKPADTAERLALARLCQLPCKKRYAAALHFYCEAFAAEPKLADDLSSQHRYNAACAAALAGCGQGADADNHDAKERARLRQQALDWLRADLTAYRQLMEKATDENRAMAEQRMQHWRKDEDFAGVRGSESLSRLPEVERKEWRKLWEEVEALRQRAAQQPKTASSAPR
jgi:serine/threonine-protein kinase